MYIYFIGVLIALLWGIRPVLQKKVLNDISPDTVMIIGGTLYFIFISIYTYFNKDKIFNELYKINDEQKKIFVFISVVGFFASILYYHMLSKESSSKVVTITSIWPIFAILFGTIILNEKFNPKLLIAVIVLIFLFNYLEN
jgi:transporter family protein